MNRPWTKEEITTLALLYEEGLPRVEIASAIGRTTSSTTSKAFGLGITQPLGTNQHIWWSSEELELLKELYVTNPVIQEVHKAFPNRTPKAIQKKAWEIGAIRPNCRGYQGNRWGIRGGRPKYTLNMNFFNTWIEESAYVFGYILADGSILRCVNPYNRSKLRIIGFELSSKDKEHLEKVAAVIDTDKKPVLHTNTQGFAGYVSKPVYKLLIASSQMGRQLVQLGIPPKKSMVVDLPKISDDVFHHFVRGYFDGDGSLYLTKENRWHISFVSGSKSLLLSLCQKLGNILNLRQRRVYSSKKKYWSLQYAQEDSLKLYDYMYEDATLWLTRKRLIPGR